MSAPGIGIVGAGIAGLHPALLLRSHSVPVTLYAATDPEGLRTATLPNTAIHWSGTRRGERQLGVAHWGRVPAPGGAHDFGVHAGFYTIGPPAAALTFTARLQEPAIAVDQRMLTARLLADAEERGAEVRIGPVEPVDLARLSEAHDLLVLTAGSRRPGTQSLAEVFPRLPGRSPYDRPQRILNTVVASGIAYTDPPGFTATFLPGIGEFFDVPFLTEAGPRTALLLEADPGGPYPDLPRPDADPSAFATELVEASCRHLPGLLERCGGAPPAIAGRRDMLRGAVTPIVRRPVARLDNGRYVLGIGDVHALNDPLLALGANAASASAFVPGTAIADHPGPFDRSFCESAAEKLWAEVRPTTEWTNAFLPIPPSPQAVQMAMSCAEDQELADLYLEQFAEPAQNWKILDDPRRTQEFLTGRGLATPLLDACLASSAIAP